MLTYFLLKALRGGADADKDGRVTTREIYDFVLSSMEREARKLNVEQTPAISPSRDALGPKAGQVWIRLKQGYPGRRPFPESTVPRMPLLRDIMHGCRAKKIIVERDSSNGLGARVAEMAVESATWPGIFWPFHHQWARNAGGKRTGLATA
ncbi:MAG: hypothetical protein HY924_13090 [Elusimicrobia bacterium]|nr:hypothetical protein [Elusimicrobiota bacterium]